MQQVLLTRWHQVGSTKQMTEEFGTLRKCLVTELVFGDAAKSELEPAQPELRHFVMHRLEVVVGVDVVISVSHSTVFTRTFNGGRNHFSCVDIKIDCRGFTQRIVGNYEAENHQTQRDPEEDYRD